MLKFLKDLAIPSWAGSLAIVVLVGVLAAWHQSAVRSKRIADQAEIYQKWGAANQVSNKIADQAFLDNQAEGQRRDAAIQGAIHAANEKTAAALADRDRALSSHDRLQQRFAALAPGGCRASQDPAAAGSGPPAARADDLRADVFRRIDQAAGQLAEYADGARGAGETCEQSYDSLRRPAEP
ncbi:MAG: DUF2514 domain-containing protein [Burkholderiaceae bacterium]|nr:DUF2514 domain-containing protein [Burkholderiaceae bacterium]